MKGIDGSRPRVRRRESGPIWSWGYRSQMKGSPRGECVLRVPSLSLILQILLRVHMPALARNSRIHHHGGMNFIPRALFVLLCLLAAAGASAAEVTVGATRDEVIAQL